MNLPLTIKRIDMSILKTALVLLAFFIFVDEGTAQVFADFEELENAPVLENGNASIVDNPDQSGINNSNKCAVYDKAAGNWYFISMLFDDPVLFEDNTILKFKMYSTMRGRVYYKFWNNDDVVAESWAHEYSSLPNSDTWVEFSVPLSVSGERQFNKLEIAGGVDNEAAGTIYLDDFRLTNQEQELGFVMQWSSRLVFYGEDGKLQYQPDSLGNVIPDFSHVGYHYGDELPPIIPVVKEISPVEGDDYVNIQSAINEVAEMPLDENGFRGAVLLKKGVYDIKGSIFIQSDGIVIRGEGNSDDENGTIIIATGTSKRPLIDIGKRFYDFSIESETEMIEEYVPLGRKFVRVEHPEYFQSGDLISLYRPGTQQWISDLKMDQIPGGSDVQQWTPAQYSFHFERIITRISGDSIFFRNPVVMAFDKFYGGGKVMKASITRYQHIGVENMLLKSEYAYETDEDHSWDAILLRNAEHSWVRDVVAKYFAYAIVNIDIDSKHISVLNCRMYEPKSVVTGGRRYTFKITGQMNLVKDCYATEGRHDYNTNARVKGPNVFTKCTSVKSSNDNGPHHRWAMGTLYDSIVTNNALNVQDRGNSGSGHGWAGVNQVFWNSSGASSVCQNPWVSGHNYNIGWRGSKDNGWHSRPDGIWEGHNLTGLLPSSLYDAQLQDRLSEERYFAVSPLLEQLSDSSFLLTFNMPADTEDALDISNYAIHGTAMLQDYHWDVELKNESEVLFTFYDIPLLTQFTTIFIDASLVEPAEGAPVKALTMARYTVPDLRPVVNYDFQRVGNGADDFVSATTSKEGILYLVKQEMVIDSSGDLEDAVGNGNAVAADVTEPNTSILFYTDGFETGKYVFYATDLKKRLSREPDNFVLIEEASIVRETIDDLNLKVIVGTPEKTILIQSHEPLNQELIAEILNIEGKLLHRDRFQGTVYFTMSAPGFYIVRCYNEKNSFVMKVVLPY
jgi:hypothetical protein